MITPYRARQANGPNALWVETVGWAEAAAKSLGSSIVVSPDGVFAADEAKRVVPPDQDKAFAPRLRRRPPEILVTATKDLRLLRRARRFDAGLREMERGAAPDLVWQQHGLFQRGGLQLARRTGAPFVLFVDAPIVWEATRWGVRRPVWGNLIERHSEAKLFASADVVACVSDSVAGRVVELGVEPDRAVVTPCAADPAQFYPRRNRGSTRAKLGVPEDEVLIAWTGSFRRFHGLDKLVAAAAGVLPRSRATMLFVGDGAERAAVEAGLGAAGVRAIFTGNRPHHEIPDLLGAADIGVVTAQDRETFHYSPIKLSEYLAAGLAVVVPDAGELGSWVENGTHGIVVPTDSVSALAEAIDRLVNDEGLRAQLGAAAVERAHRLLTYDKALADVLDRLAAVGRRD
jgi:glycosyltransferase involved in cell wall biosynthesis